MQSTKFAPSTYTQNSKIFHALSPAHNPHFYKDWTHEDVWVDYMTRPTEKLRQIALEELLKRQNGMLAQIAHYVWRAHPHAATFEDFLQYARLEAISAYKRFDMTKDIKLNTFVYISVNNSLMSTSDNIVSIRCPSGKRGFRSYFKGAYDNKPKKKEKFEQINAKCLENEDKREETRSQCGVIDAEMISYDDYITTEEGDVIERNFSSLFGTKSVGGLTDPIDWSGVVDKLSNLQKKIYDLHFERCYNIKEIEQSMELPNGEVRKQIRLIKEHFKMNFPELVAA